MKGLVEDLRYALRLYRQTRSSSITIVVILATGMAFVAALLSLYTDAMLRPEPGFEPGGRIITVSLPDGLPLDVIERISNESTTIEHIAGAQAHQFRVGLEEEPVSGELVTHDFFPGLKPNLVLGRGFSAAEHDPKGEPVVVISWNYWQRNYSGKADVLGRMLQIEGQSSGDAKPAVGPSSDESPTEFRIVGVVGPDYTGTWRNVAFWMPMERGIPITIPRFSQLPESAKLELTRSWASPSVARTAPGVGNAAVLSELNSRFSEIAGTSDAIMKYDVIDNFVLSPPVQREVQKQLELFLGAAVLLALVASANVSLFLLARAPGRRRELGIRMAVGAPTRRLARQLVSEAALLVAAAAVIGLLLSVWLAKFLRGLPFLERAQWGNVTLLDWRVLSLVILFAVTITLLVSLAPILGLNRLGIAGNTRQVSARATVSQRLSGTVQISIAGALGAAAIAFAWHLLSAMLSYPGYNTKEVYVARYAVKKLGRVHTTYGVAVAAGIVQSVHQRETFASVPGIRAATVANTLPGVDIGSTAPITMRDPRNAQKQVQIYVVQIDSRYVDLLHLQLLNGRNIKDGDDGVLVNRTFAMLFYGRESVAGETLPPLPASIPGALPMENVQVAGVLKDVSYGGPLTPIYPMIFTSVGMPIGGNVIVDSKVSAAALQAPIAEASRQLDLRLVGSVVPLSELRARILAPDRARSLMTIVTATIVVALAILGFYGTQRYLVSAGRREYAVRASLGAGPRALGRLVLRRGLLMGLPGIIIGTPLAFILVAWLRGNYVSSEISPFAIATIVVLGIIALLLAASLGPARLARRTQPASLLRED